jgi:hypothetical protein
MVTERNQERPAFGGKIATLYPDNYLSGTVV